MAGLISDIFGGEDPNLGQYASNALSNYQNINTPNLKWNTYSPEAYDPTTAQANLVQNNPLVAGMQMQALQQMGNLANTGLSDVDQQGYQQARDIGNQMANAQTGAALQNAQARGIGGSGLEFAQREMAGQAGAQRAQQAGLQQAADAARERALYNQAYSNALGNFQAQNTNLNAQNAGILNQFNMANTQNQNAANQYNVGNQNQAQLINTQGANNVAQQNFNNQMSKAGGMLSANQMGANAEAANNAAQNNQMNNMMNFGLGAANLYNNWGE